MGRFVLQRVLQGAVVVVGVTVIVFVVTRLIGDPVSLMLPLEATAEQRAAFAASLGLDQPIPTQFADFLQGAVRLDFGDSLWQARPAFDIVRETLPRTVLLVVVGLALAVVLAIPVGIFASLRPGSWIDRALVTGSLIGLSIPQFWLGLMLILLFAVWLGVLPTSGTGGFEHLILPAVTLALPTFGRLTMMVRSSMIDELNLPYVETSRAKGMPEWRTVFLHAFRNASNPTVTMIGWEAIRAIAGYSVIVESVFAWPGIGFMAIRAINQQDLVLLQAIVFVVAVIVVVVNLAMDFIYKLIDPRIQLT